MTTTLDIVVIAASKAIELVMDLVDLIEQAGVQVDPQEVIKRATARVKARKADVSATQKAVLDILDGTTPLP